MLIWTLRLKMWSILRSIALGMAFGARMIMCCVYMIQCLELRVSSMAF